MSSTPVDTSLKALAPRAADPDAPYELPPSDAQLERMQEAALGELRAVPAANVGYLEGQRKFLLKLSEKMPQLANKLLGYLLASPSQSITPGGQIVLTLDDPSLELTEGQIALFRTLLPKLLPGMVSIGSYGQDVAPGANGNKISITINTVGGPLPNALRPVNPKDPTIITGEAVPTTRVVFKAPEVAPALTHDDPTPVKEAAAARPMKQRKG